MVTQQPTTKADGHAVHPVGKREPAWRRNCCLDQYATATSLSVLDSALTDSGGSTTPEKRRKEKKKSAADSVQGAPAEVAARRRPDNSAGSRRPRTAPSCGPVALGHYIKANRRRPIHQCPHRRRQVENLRKHRHRQPSAILPQTDMSAFPAFILLVSSNNHVINSTESVNDTNQLEGCGVRCSDGDATCQEREILRRDGRSRLQPLRRLPHDGRIPWWYGRIPRRPQRLPR